jgi:hypothetical protein
MAARYAIGGTIAALLLALPVMAVAKQGGPVATVATQQCAQERVDLGKKAFHRRYGEKHTMRNCIRRTPAEGRGGRHLGDRGLPAGACPERCGAVHPRLRLG